MACPSNCVCIWKGGKQTVECINKSMITIPDGIDPNTQVLDLTGNNLKMLGSEQFQRMDLLNLQKIFLSRCRLTQLDDRTLKGLTNLVEMDLSNNILSIVPVELFADVTSLMKLYMNGNPFKIVKSYSFRSLRHLMTLELSRCQLEVIEKDAFYGLVSLEQLKLEYNSLKNMPGIYVSSRLHGVGMHHNPWFCDCNMQDMYNWLNVSSMSSTSEAICDGPQRLRGAPIKLLDEQELACLPDVTPTSLYLEISEGKNVSLVCRVNAIPEAKISWRFQDHVLQNDSIIAPGVHLYYYLEDGGTEKTSELFIFNANVEDNGTFICVAENQAGKAQSNYTIRIVLKEEPLIHSKRIPSEYLLGLCVVAAVIAVFVLICAITCILRYRVKKRRRRKKEKNKELALYNDDARGASPITRNGEPLSAINDNAIMTQKSNGGIFNAEQVGVLKMSTIAETVGNTPISHVFYPCSPLASEQNPDLINDTGKDRKPPLPTNFESLGVQDLYAGRGGVTLAPQSGCVEPIPENIAYNAAISQCQEAVRGWTASASAYDPNLASPGVCSLPVNVCFNNFQVRDIHLTPEKFIVDGYPTDYGLPKVPTHFAPILPATAFYRTLPHRRHNAGGNVRFIREAEFLTHSVQPASYEHFRTGDVRYNVEGYPKDSPSYTYTGPHVSFSDTVQILGKSSDSSIESNTVVAQRNEVAVTTCSAQTQSENHVTEDAQTNKRSETQQSTEAKLMKTRKLTVCNKNSKTDSPDEGYVGECPDTTDV